MNEELDKNTAAPEAKRGLRKTRTGKVVSKSGDKSVVVSVERRMPHPLYGKVVRVHKKYHVHDEENIAAVGDKVLITECHPVSRTKCWRLVRKVSTGTQE